MFSKKEKKLIDMTGGGVAKPLIQFALPLVGGSIFQLLYSTTDVLFVGNLIGKIAAAAVGASSLLVYCLVGLFTGISVGTGVAISHCIGAKDKTGARDMMHTAAGFALLAGAILMILGEIFAPFALRLMNTPDNIFTDAVLYIRYYFIGMIPMIVYNIGSGVLRACGDSKSPFYILAIGGFVNVAVDALMIGVFQLGVVGAALATTLSQGLSAVAVVIMLLRGNEVLKLQVSKIRIKVKCLKTILRYGLPAGIQSMVITLSNLIVQYYINGYGADSVAAYTAYFKLENFTYMPVLAFGQAAMTFTGQNIGAGRKDRAQKGTAVAAGLSVAFVAAISIVLLVLGRTAVGWFVKDEAVIDLGIKIIAVSFPFYWLNSLIEVFGGTIRGMGHSLSAMIVVLTFICGARILLLNIFERSFHNIQMLTAVYPISWALAVIGLFCVMMKLFTAKE